MKTLHQLDFMNITNKKEDKSIFFLFFIFPFYAFILSFKNLKNKYSIWVIFLFYILFGYTFIVQDIKFDSYSYVENFENYQNAKPNNYFNDLANYSTFNSNIKDIYDITSYFLISRLTRNYHILFAFWALIFAFFFLKSFQFFICRREFVKSITVYLLTFLFIYSNNLFNINGVRFWTAAWIAVYVIFEIVINKNYKFIFLALITPLIHISYFLFLAILLTYILLSKFNTFWVVTFIISFFISQFSIELIQNYKYLVPTFIQNMIWAYTESMRFENRIDYLTNLPLYVKLFDSLPNLFVNFLMFIFILKSKHLNTKESKSIYIFLLIWLSFSNFTMTIPSLGNRFIFLALPLIAYLCLLNFSKIPFLKKAIYLIPFVYSYSIFYWFRHMIEVTYPLLLLSFFPHLLIKNLF